MMMAMTSMTVNDDGDDKVLVVRVIVGTHWLPRIITRSSIV